MRTPESQETFDAEFKTSGLSLEECMSRVEDLLIELRIEAGKLAGEWLSKNGYFNGGIEGNVQHYPNTNRCVVEVVLSCYGLPLAIDDDYPKAIEACRRYFDHCERVSLSGPGCNSIEMSVRKSLKEDARNSVFSILEAANK